MGSRTFFILSFGFSTFFEFPTIIYFFSIKKMNLGDFPGGPVARTLRSQGRGPGFDPGASTKTQCCQINKYFLKKENEFLVRLSHC